MKRNIFISIAILAVALLIIACPQPGDFHSGSVYPRPGSNFPDNVVYAEDQNFPEVSDHVTVWLDTEGGTQNVEYENLQAALDWLKDNAVHGGNYTVHLGRDQIIAPQTLSYGASIVSITLYGVRGEKQISPSKIGSLFTIGANVTLTLDRGITLEGLSNNLVPLVSVEKDGTMVMKDGSTIRDNNNIRNHLFTSNGAGVSVAGKFIMDGGSILNNKVPGLCTGGGVIIIGAGEFTMNGGLISGNYAESTGGGVGFYHSLTSEERAVFLMTGGTISNNTSGSGGGVYVSDFGNFTMTGGTISNNSASAGGGVYVSGISWGESGEFIMTGGVINNNLTESNGGGIFSQYAHKGKVVIGGNAVISGNEANITNPFHGNSCGGGIYTSSIILEGNCVIEGNKARNGGGVYLTYHENINTVTFTMTGGVIRSNTAIEYGGGVALCYLSQGQRRDYTVPFAFDKTGGTIYGYDGGDNANIVLNAVNKDGRPPRPGEDEDE
ncbi:MAG: right-handed parallel beta-helix repeat-containing protein, partial [Treponema sp.]|nr:right-handed parallel beta-helix repeat-containing protein [Treponema sp.]